MTKTARQFLIGGMGVLLVLGMLYGWSIFVEPIEAEFGFSRSETSLVFSFCMAAFHTGSFLTGFLIRKFSRSALVRVAGLLVAGGFLLAATTSALWHIYLFYGVLCGLGIGIGYNAIVGCVNRWFPKSVGKMMGIMLLAFGTGGMILGMLVAQILDAMGWRPAFCVLGVLCGAICLLGSFFIRLPKADGSAAEEEAGENEYTTGEMLKTRQFWGYAIWSFFISTVGFVQFAHAAPAVGVVTPNLTLISFVAGILSLCNGLGRVLGGTLLDRWPPYRVFFFNSFCYAGSMLFMMLSVLYQSMFFIVISFVVGGLCYGCQSVANVAYFSKTFGKRHYQMNLGVFSVVPLIAAFVGPYMAGALHDSTGSYAVSSGVSIGVALVSAIGVYVIWTGMRPGAPKAPEARETAPK